VNGRRWPLATFAAVTDSLHSNDLHAPPDPLAGQSHALPEPELVMHPRRAVGPAGGRVDHTDLIRQMRIGQVACRRSATAPIVIARARHLQHPAGHRDIDAVSGKFMDQPEPYFGSTFSRAK
jgi:hypothetical protein